jgi:hypothetical protein
VAIIAAAEVSRVGEQVEAVGKTGEVEANICRENEVEIGGVKRYVRVVGENISSLPSTRSVGFFFVTTD